MKWLKRLKELVPWSLVKGAFAVAGIILLLVAVYWVPKYWTGDVLRYPPSAEPVWRIENELRQTVIQVLGGLVVILGLWAALRRAKALEGSLRITERGNLTDRFTRAIDQLGATYDIGEQKGIPNLEVRLGAIYALEQISKEAPDEYYRTVIEILTSYCRMRKPPPVSEEETPEALPDIQAVMDVLRRREPNMVGSVQIDLSGAFLIDARLALVNLSRAWLPEANLSGASLGGADLSGACLGWADLSGVDLCDANLSGADLSRADLRYACLREADVCESNLRGADLRPADLREADLRLADLVGAKLDGAILRGANLRGADLRTAELKIKGRPADCTDAKILASDLKRACRDASDFPRANIIADEAEGGDEREELE